MERNADIPLPDRTASALRSRQSVRATFRLTPHAIEAISIVAVHLGIRQKSLFDHLVEDRRLLSAAAREIPNEEMTSEKRVQKTYVLSRRSLFSLEKVSKEFDTPRDVLVEYCVRRLMPVIEIEKEKHKRRVQIFAELSGHFEKGMEILRKSERMLDGDDPVKKRIEKLMSVYAGIYKDTRVFIKRSEIIENF